MSDEVLSIDTDERNRGGGFRKLSVYLQYVVEAGSRKTGFEIPHYFRADFVYDLTSGTESPD